MGQRTWRTVIQLPLGACTNPLPLFLPQPTALSAAPLSPVAVPLLSVHWPSLVNAGPGKGRERGSVTKARFSHKIVKEQSGRLNNIKQMGNTSLNNPFASSSVSASTPYLHPWMCLVYLVFFLRYYPFLFSFQWLICKGKQYQMNQGDLAGRSGKQMIDLMDQFQKRENSYSNETVWHKRERWFDSWKKKRGV